MKRRVSRGRQVAERFVAKISTAATLAAAWRRPAGSSELTPAADDSGFASSGRLTASPDHATSSTPVDWLDMDRLAVCRVPGAVGIVNHNNTCFINAVIQCLSNTPAFVLHTLNYVIRHDRGQTNKLIQRQTTEDGELGKELSLLLGAMWTGRYSVDSSRAFHDVVRRLASDWYKGDEQNDAHEFAAWMLNRLQDDRFGASNVDSVKQAGNDVITAGSDTLQRQQRSVVDQLFSATCRSTLVCPGCGRQSDKLEPLLSVSLPIPTRHSSTASQRAMITVYVIVVRQMIQTTHKPAYRAPAVRHGFQLTSSKRSTVAKLKRLVSDQTGIPHRKLVLAEVLGHEFNVTLHRTQSLHDVCNMQGCVYAFDTSSTSERHHDTSTVDDVDHLISIIALSCDVRKARRLGRPMVFQLRRDVSFDDLVAALLTNLSDMLREDVHPTAAGAAPFLIRLMDGPDDISPYLTPDMRQPLITSTVQQALLSCSKGYGPQHIKLTLEWKTSTYRRLTMRCRNHVIDDVSVQRVINNHQQQAGNNLTDCFNCFTQQERLEDENTWYCNNCKHQQLGTIKKLTLSSLPDILIIHLKRFKQDVRGTRTKLESLIEFPVTEGLDMSTFVDANNNHRCLAVRKDFTVDTTEHKLQTSCGESHIYDLYAVCSHTGSLQSGHYTATCRSPVNNAWYLFDDHHVTQVPAKTVVTKDAYMLFYERRCERNSAASAHLRAFVTAPSGDTSLASVANSSVDNTFDGVPETHNTTYDSYDVSASDSSFQNLPASSTQSTPSRRPRYRVSFVDISRKLSSASRRPPLPPGTVDRRASRPPSGHQHVQVIDARSYRHMHQMARQRAMRSRSWHSLTTPEPLSQSTHTLPSTDTAPHRIPKSDPSTSFIGGKFRFLSQLFSKKSTQSLADSSVTAEPSLRPALRASNLSRSASAGRITDAPSHKARSPRTVRWDISQDMQKTIVIPTWKRPKKVLLQESSV